MFLTSCAVVYVIITTFATVTESFTFLSRKTLSTKIFSRSLEVFENGWENNGVSVINAKHAVVVYGNTEVRGLVAIESISTNDAIVSLPESNCLAVPEVVSGAVPGTIEAEAPTVRLAVFLLKEWLKGETSTYSNYISFLPEPKSVNTPLHWPSELISKFPYAFMVLSVNRQVQRWNVLYDKFIANNPNLPGATKEVRSRS